ncbi:hypothetical protein NM22_08765 [Vibrio tubiashii]|nr:hypothetical protein NM22_08765 [Vibrio tubiashii]
MKYSLVLAMLSSLVIGSVNAATLIPKGGVSILYINGEPSQSRIGENKISGGFNQIVVKMDKNMSKGSSSDVFTSKPFAISFTLSGEEVVIEHPLARSMAEAQRAFGNNDPKWVVKVDGKQISYQQSAIKGKSGFLPFSGLDKLLVQHNENQGIFFKNGQLIDKPVEAQAIAVAATTTAAVTSTSIKVEKTAQAKPVSSSNVDQLKAWYLKSSKEERKAFRRWMIDQE